MPVLHLEDLPREVYESLQQWARAPNHTVEAEVVGLLRQGFLARTASRSQAELGADLRRRSFVPPPGTPNSGELPREERGR